MFSFSDRVEVPNYVMVRLLGDESVLLNMKAEIYYGLDATGTRMWQVLITSSSIEKAYEELLAEFDVGEALLSRNLTDLIAQLVDKGLLQIQSADMKSPASI